MSRLLSFQAARSRLRRSMFKACCLLLCTTSLGSAFLLPPAGVRPLPSSPVSSEGRRHGLLEMTAESSSSSPTSGQSRRQLLRDGTAAVLGLTLGTMGLRRNPSLLEAAHAAGDGAIAVLGARGRTGRLIIQGLLKLGKPVRAITREPFTFSASEMDQSLTGSLEYALGDVTKPETLGSAVKGAAAVVFASSASKKGGNAEQVDYLGVVNAARACLDNGVSRYLVISSGAVSRPDSFGYKVTNIFGGIMGWKIKGENEVRRLYAKQAAGKSQTYTIVRPGGLSNDKPKGVQELEVNQGDTLIGEISRADVADACVNALLSKETENATFEVYETGRRYPLQAEFPQTSGLEHHGSTWTEMLAGLRSDVELGIVPS